MRRLPRIFEAQWISLVIVLAGLSGSLRPQGETQPTTQPVSRPTSRTAPVRELGESELRKIRELITALSDPDFATREAAHESLADIGSPALRVLIALPAPMTLEARIRLQRLIEDLREIDAAAQSTSVLSTRITYTCEETPLALVLEELERLSGVRFPESPGVSTATPMTLSLNDVPFLEALDRVADLARVNWQQDFMPGSFRLQPGTIVTPFRTYVGPYRVALNRVTYNSTLAFGSEIHEQGFFQGQFDVDPAADVAGVWLPPEIIEMTDDQGRSLKPEGTLNAAFNVAQGRKSFYFSLNFAMPAKDAQRVGVLRGKIRVSTPKRIDRYVFSVAADSLPVELETSGVKARLIAINAKGNDSSLVFEVDRRPLIADDRFRQPISEQKLEIRTRRGEIIRPHAPPGRSSTPERETLTFQVPMTPADQMDTIELAVVAELTVSVMEFEFRDVPLP